MSSHRCTSCGTKVDETADACPLCGMEPETKTDSESSTGDDESKHPSLGIVARIQRSLPEDTTVFYRITVSLTVTYSLFVGASVVLGQSTLFGVGLLFMVGSLVTMYLDLLGLGVRLYETRPILWIVGAALMYFLVVPLYVYKRQHAA